MRLSVTLTTVAASPRGGCGSRSSSTDRSGTRAASSPALARSKMLSTAASSRLVAPAGATPSASGRPIPMREPAARAASVPARREVRQWCSGVASMRREPCPTRKSGLQAAKARKVKARSCGASGTHTAASAPRTAAATRRGFRRPRRERIPSLHLPTSGRSIRSASRVDVHTRSSASLVTPGCSRLRQTRFHRTASHTPAGAARSSRRASRNLPSGTPPPVIESREFSHTMAGYSLSQ
mmetsp:Transcript_36684/g.115302  ORF Transcript_36684/g.115302 Transcript_36684/m.115302 type:complete len:239 (-) Transcript_36684:205-921(-)